MTPRTVGPSIPFSRFSTVAVWMWTGSTRRKACSWDGHLSWRGLLRLPKRKFKACRICGVKFTANSPRKMFLVTRSFASQRRSTSALARENPDLLRILCEATGANCDAFDKPRTLSEWLLDYARKLTLLHGDIYLGAVTEILHARLLGGVHHVRQGCE